MVEANRDVVAGRISLDTSKILPAFKVIDGGALKNAESFKTLNKELLASEKSYTSMAKAMDKMALTSDERRKKILDESNALVAQRKAAADLLNAKKNQLDETSKIVDSKLQTQLAIQKKRQEAAEQQEREHQKRMETLQNRADTSGAQASRAIGSDAAARERALQYEQNTRRRIAEMELRNIQTQAAARERALQQEQRIRREIDRQANPPGSGGTIGQSAQYLLTNTLYYQAIQGTKEAIKVIREFEDNLVDLQRVMERTTDFDIVKQSMIDNAKEYGYALRDVGKTYVQIAQQGFNSQDTAELARIALMAKNVESSFASAEEAQKLLTAGILNLGLEAKDSEMLLDKINQVSNDYATTSKKLLEGITRTGAAAKNAGVPMSELIGYLTVLNTAGFTGANAGNAIKSFISFSSRDIAIDKLEKYVGTIKQANGAMMPFSEILQRVSEQWKTLADTERHEITQAIARGDQASKFIALMNNYSKVLDVVNTAEGSIGSAHRENTLAMTTLTKQSAQLKAEWESLMVTVGDTGLLAALKFLVNQGKYLVEGFNSLPTPIRNTAIAVIALGTSVVVLNTGLRILTGESLKTLVTGLAAGTRSMFGLAGATTAANTAQKAFIATPLGAALTLLTAVIGASTLAWSYYNGEQKQVEQTMSSNQKQVNTLYERYKELKKVVDDNTKSDKEIKVAKDQLGDVIVKITSLMPDLTSAFDKNGKAIDINIGKIEEWKRKYGESVKLVESQKIRENTAKKEELEQRIKSNLNDQTNYSESDLSLWDKITGKTVNSYREDRAKQILLDGQELEKIEQSLKDSQEAIDIANGKKSASQPFSDRVQGKDGMTDEAIADAYDARKKDFDAEMKSFTHMVNMEKEGYVSANEQLSRLQEIRAQYQDGLQEEDLFSLDELIHRTDSGIKLKAKGMGTTQQATTPYDTTENYKNNPFERSMKDLEGELKASESISQRYKETSQEYREELQKQYEVHIKRRDLQKGEAARIREENDALERTLETTKQSTEQRNKTLKQLEDNKNTLADLGMRWWDYELQAEQASKKLSEVITKFSEEQFSHSQKWIAHEKAIREMSAREELEAWERIQSQYIEGTEQRLQADEQVYAARKAAINEEMSFSEKWIAHEKAIGKLTPGEEIAAWERVQGLYLEGTEQRMKADEQLYSLRKQAFQEEMKRVEEINKKELDALDKLVKAEKKYIDESKKAELDRIDSAKKAYVEAQDAKIAAIDALLAAEQEANEDKDYETQLAEKQARVKVLESAVGADGKKERKDLLKEIEKMQEDHNRDIRKRDFESQKKALQEEKSNQEKAFDAQKDAAETHFQSLLDALDLYNSDAEGRAEALKQLQILKESEKNVEILKNLDAFIVAYQAKMNRITPATSKDSYDTEKVYVPVKTQRELDLEEYNRNKDLWEQANADGDTSRMAGYNRRNQEIRNKYGIPEDTGKLQRFREGGIVQGVRGQEIPVIAHAKEMFLNEAQQSSLFKLLSFAMPKISMPSMDFSGPKTVTNNHYNFDNSIGEVAVSGGVGVSGLYDQRTGLVERQRTMGSRVR